MERFTTYINKHTNEYASWSEDYKCWVTHASPKLFPETHTKESWVKLMEEWFPGVFEMTDDYELIYVTVTRA